MLNKYYQDELSFLRELGREFSETYPEVAPFLAERGSDPDVERLLEGFAFLAGRIREKLDDEYPELTHALIQLLWPHYLRPIPSLAVVQFEPLPQAQKEAHRIPRGTLVDSMPIDGTVVRFQTAYDVTLQPLVLDGVELRLESPSHLRLKLRLPEGVDIQKVEIPSLRLFLQGEPVVARALYLCLLHNLERIVIRPLDGEAREAKTQIVLEPDRVRPVGFGADEALLPTPRITFEGFRLIHEYFAYPTKFQFVDILGLERLRQLKGCRTLEMTFLLRRLPEDMPALGTGGFLLNCCPVVNLFPHDADPIRVEPERTEYRIRPSGTNPAHFEIYSVDRVTGLVRGTGQPREYHPFFGFHHSPGGDTRDVAYYRARREPSSVREGTETHIAFVDPSGERVPAPSDVEVVSLELTCSNRQLASRLRVGDISVPGPTSPVFARFRNVSRVTPAVPPPLGGDTYWRLLSHLAQGYLSLASLENLRTVLSLYNFRGLVDRQAEAAGRQLLDGIKGISIEPATRLLRGAPVRGLTIRLDMEEDNFAGEGDMYMFSSLLNEFFALYVTVNSFSQLEVRGLKYGEVYRWPPRLGTQTAL